jgi:adenylate cyclase
MEARLSAIAGPLKGTTIPLTDVETIIGCDPGNTLAINDPLISRRHCSIRYSNGQVQLSDLDSLNSTFVNGESVRKKQLEHGDRIKVGASQFIFLVHDETAYSAVPLSDSFLGELITTLTVKLDRRDPVFLLQDNASEALPPNPRLARDFAAVLRISTAINGIKKAEELQRRVLDMMFEVLPIERGAILLNGPHSDEFVSGVYRDRVSDVSEPFRISRTIARQVLRDGVAVIANDVLNDQQFSPTESIVASQIRSLLCVPLFVFCAKLGVIYADTTRPGAQLDEHHLHLLTAIASVTSVALEHARYVESLE